MKRETTWGSKNAEDMYAIATRLAGFDPGELMVEIHRRSDPYATRVNEPTVLKAMQAVQDRYPEGTQA